MNAEVALKASYEATQAEYSNIMVQIGEAIKDGKLSILITTTSPAIIRRLRSEDFVVSSVCAYNKNSYKIAW